MDIADTIPVLASPEDLTQTTIVEMSARVEALLGDQGPGVVIDLRATRFMNSTGLGWLVQTGKRLNEGGRRLALANANRKVLRLMRLVGLDEVLPLFRGVEEASRHVRGEAPAA